MTWELDKNKPICPQICEHLCVMIASGEIKPKEKIVSVREIALSAGVNPNTVQKSLEELERKGLINSVRSVGWFVGEDIDAAKETVEKLKKEKTEAFFKSMEALGVSKSETLDYIGRWSQ